MCGFIPEHSAYRNSGTFIAEIGGFTALFGEVQSVCHPFATRKNKKDVMNIMQGIQKEFLGYMRELIPELNVSLSIGGTERTANEDTKTLYDRADKALYQAKNQKGELRLYEQTI